MISRCTYSSTVHILVFCTYFSYSLSPGLKHVLYVLLDDDGSNNRSLENVFKLLMERLRTERVQDFDELKRYCSVFEVKI